MHHYTLTHLSDAVLLRDLALLVSHDRVTTATLLAHIAEVDARRLYVPAGYSSMHAYCVDELHLSEDAAFRRIRAARAARQFPALFAALADGRLHLAAVCVLAPHLTQDNADVLIKAATRRRKCEIEELLAHKFGSSELSARVRAIEAIPSHAQLVPGRVERERSADADPQTQDTLAPGQVEHARPQSALASPGRFLIQATIAKSTHEKLRYAQSLLSHAVPTGDVSQVLDRALDALITQLEKRKFGGVGGRQPRRLRIASSLATAGSRYVPAHVRRAVWERDQGQCTFVSARGTRCKARRCLEFDHVDPVARGGQARVNNMRLRCRAHNQYEAERAFGAGFMVRKRQEARLAAAKAGTRTVVTTTAAAAGEAHEQARDVLAGLRGLGCSADEARRAAEFSATIQGATLEDRMRAALKFLVRGSIQGRTSVEGVNMHR